jgi:hypothetical protein
MPHRSTHTDHFKGDSLPLRLKNRLSEIAQKFFAVPDADARRHGWQVTVKNGGFARRYRDTRFDYLVRCTACNGRGRNPRGTTCSACNGTGRKALDQATVSQSRQGRP